MHAACLRLFKILDTRPMLRMLQVLAVVLHYASTGITLGLVFSFKLDTPVVLFIAAGVCLQIATAVLYFWTSLIDTTDLLHQTDDASLQMFCDRCNVCMKRRSLTTGLSPCSIAFTIPANTAGLATNVSQALTTTVFGSTVVSDNATIGNSSHFLYLSCSCWRFRRVVTLSCSSGLSLTLGMEKRAHRKVKSIQQFLWYDSAVAESSTFPSYAYTS
jgi:hypothetical protein